ncbi:MULTISPECIES: glutamine--tRNA ligase/YqeY domain fusion protein [unclassified Paenibacillus]|uniref:glutamine--tRNA ligase/YqeY domain fusion protein n=1 Tax=unclassified Paenibacillus TaxID=185978 RepID=UPI0003E22070|nr:MULTISPECIES: glutamine--tRNA ligase/YqeY domain fusion protein [unclassified Paenibacillus]ETT49808.1 glutaminyl-tRNA ligase [Paenibacillus sp. FSL R7-269]OMF90642.1 glutamine--tRNA ligase [Paenibacillus sp. FSL R7-0337]
MTENNGPALPENYMDRLIREDVEAGAFSREICTRFPPEPNGYLHIGSAFAIHTNVGIARKYGGCFHLRFDDTNPLKEDKEYVEAIIRDLEWLGCSPGEHIYYGSDYSEEIYRRAETLILKGKAYVCDLTAAEVTAYRGSLTGPGQDSPYRSRTPEENLRLFRAMRKGEYPSGAKVLRARIDMASPNMNLRDPVLYRIIHAGHYRTGNAWCIYPMYDFAHPIQDALEGVTHSLCSIEFKDHRPLYEWVLRELEIPEAPRQREFGRVNLTGVVTSKRYLRELVAGNYVDGWDDPRLPTLSGLRRRGFTPESIRDFVREIGMVRNTAMVDFSLLEHCLRQDLKAKVPAVMAVLDPLKVVLTNYAAGASELLPIPNNPENAELGSREVPFSGMLYIERADFMEVPVKGFRRLVPGGEVRLKGGYIIRCHEVIKDAQTGAILELRCTYDPETKSGGTLSGRKVKGTVQWVSAAHALKSDVYLYEQLLTDNNGPKEEGESWEEYINPGSVTLLTDCLLEPLAGNPKPGDTYQFLRHGYFCIDSRHSTAQKLVFNRIVPLKDTWRGNTATSAEA